MAGIPERVHLIGVGGMHLSGIARILASWGHRVSGSDMRLSPMTEALAAVGVTALEGHQAENVGDAEMIVTTSAAKSDNPELVEARRRGIPILKRHEFVARLMDGKRSICVAGTHGKTTTTGMIASMLVQAGRDPTYLVGGDVRDLGTNAAPGAGVDIVVEADEFDRAFLAYGPDIAVITNVEPDHLDIYGSFDGYAAAFEQFMSQVKPDGTLIACIDSPKVRDLLARTNIAARVETYALDRDADWTARDIERLPDGGQAFTAMRNGQESGRFDVSLAIRHDVANALGAIAAGHAAGLTAEEMQLALPRYRGAERRFGLVGEAAGVSVMDDYAHHPTEVADTVTAARERFGGRRIIAVFQPHTYSRTQYLLEGFRTCFHGLDELIVLATYAAREPESAGMDAYQLSQMIEEPRARFAADFSEATDIALDILRPGDVFFTTGAGDVDAVGPMVLEALNARTSMEEQDRREARRSGRSMAPLIAQLQNITNVREHEPLARHTTFGIGGPADLYVVVENADQLAKIVIACREHEAPVFVLGSGSNILIGDRGIRGVVIENRARAVTGPEQGAEGELLFQAESGASFAAVARHLARDGFAGLEWASGIPGTLGGAVVYNAGAYGGCLGDVLRSISYVNGTGTTREAAASELDLVYRGSVFTRGQFEHRVVLSAQFALWSGEPETLMHRVRELDGKRLLAQPRGRNAGSIFKNMPDHPAWRVIDEVGLRGHRIGDAQVSDKHCNFFINVGQARAADVKALIDLARARVHERFAIQMELEIGLIGEGFGD
jgi:UDP-N-acetylmuramate--L-alanine ligase/UDP-N-acetylenolpyruvoylglucosamine reductase